MSISKNKIKFIASLKQKKVREVNKLFVVEGEKMVSELLKTGFTIELTAALPIWLNANKHTLINKNIDFFEVNNDELLRISSLKTPNNVVAVVKQAVNNFQIKQLYNKLTLVLDDIQDPGNLGTIIRIADWFGIEHIICSENTVDVYNPKVVQATMGTLLRVKLHYANLLPLLNTLKNENIAIYGAFLKGENIYTTNITPNGVIVMGNESKGISTELTHCISHSITIPSGQVNGIGSESLNVSVATAIICAEFTRKRLFT